MENSEKERLLKIMRNLEQKRSLEILKSDIEDVNLDTDYQKKLANNKVLNVKYLGKIKWKEEIDGKTVETEKDIFLLIEQKENENGDLIEVERYYTEDGEMIAGNNLGDGYKDLMLNEKYLEREDLLLNLKQLDEKGLLDLNEINQERLEQIAKALGIKVDDLKNVAEINTDKPISEKEPEEKEQISKKEIEKVSTKSEIDTSQKVTDQETMASLLHVEDRQYVKIAVVYSDKLNDNPNSTKFSFVGIKPDGSAEIIDTLEQRYGTTPTKSIYNINNDGTQIEEEKANSIFQIKGEEESQVAVKFGSSGTIETKYVRTPRENNQTAISIPIENEYEWPTSRETREFMNENRNTRVDDEIERIENTKSESGKNEEEILIENIDDNKENDKLQVEIREKYIEHYTKKILENENITEVFNYADVEKRVRNVMKEKAYLSEDELRFIENSLEKDAQLEHQPRGIA